MADFELTSTAFENGQRIPARYTCEGEDLSPPLMWSDVPAEARSLALVCDDPDAPGGTFTHWLAWAIDPGMGGIAEGESARAEGENDFGTTGYRGPCPPPGHGPHRYFFRLYAMPEEPDLPPGAGKSEVERAVDGALGIAELVGTFER